MDNCDNWRRVTVTIGASNCDNWSMTTVIIGEFNNCDRNWNQIAVVLLED